MVSSEADGTLSVTLSVTLGVTRQFDRIHCTSCNLVMVVLLLHGLVSVSGCRLILRL